MGLQLLYFGATFLLSLGLGLYLTPLVRRGALKFGVLDHPNGELKRQTEAIPYLGGIAIYLAFLITLGLVFDFEPRLLGLLLAGTMIAMLGLFDDLRVLPAELKLAGQGLAAWVAIKSDISIQLVFLPAYVAIPLTVLWLAGIANAMNIVDVSDGLSGGTAAIAATALFVIAILNQDTLIAVTSLAMVGACTGFLRYNQPPARIYLGDTGSMFLGFMLAAISMIGSYTEHSPLGALAPIFILVVPLTDTTLVVLARISRGISPLNGSPDHFAVRLQADGWSPGGTALYGYALGLVGGVVGISLVLVSPSLTPWVVGIGTTLFAANLAWLWTRPIPGVTASQPASASSR